MNLHFFHEQWKRLTTRFGEKAMDPEFQKLALDEVKSMSDFDFREVVNIWIGNRPHTKAPMLADFREARLSKEKRNFNNETKQASRTWENFKAGEESKIHLADLLEREYGGGIRTIKDALGNAGKQK